jgi:arginine decarboxylase
LNQNEAPFWEALTAYARVGVLPFHTPGHKLRPGAFARLGEVLGEGLFALDPSDMVEAPELDHDFLKALAQAEELAAELFGARRSLFLVNGTTGGLHYLLMPVKGSVLIPRFSHQAVYSALVLAQGRAVYLPAAFDSQWLIPLPPAVEEVAQALAREQPEALVLTHPTYYGTAGSLAELAQLAKRYGTLLFVDEAHGGHFRFSPALPATGLECGADAVVQSTHKTLGALTQSSMLHCNNDFWYAKVVQARQVLQTTSPSLVLLAVLDEVRRVLALQGRELVERAVELGRRCARELAALPNVEVVPEHLNADPTRIVFSLRELGLTGKEVERILRVDYNIQVELSDYYHVLALISVGDTPESAARLVQAVGDVVARRAHLGREPLPRYKVEFPDLPPAALSLREGFFQDKEEIPLAEAAGRISGGFLTPYPPGVPLIVPGEVFTPEIVEYALWCAGLGWSLRGMAAEQKVLVLKENGSLCRTVR